MTQPEKQCRRCLLRELEAAAMDSVVHFYARQPEHMKVPSGVYEERLERCRGCGELDRGTCMQCGCYVEVRAALKRGTCPMGRWPTYSR